MKENTKFNLSKFIVPSIISMVLVSTYTNIDGFFIGNVSGDDGLAAINLVWPIVALITSLGTGIGVGGSVIMNALRGKNQNEDAENIKKTTLWLLFITGIVSGIVLFALHAPLVSLMGAAGGVYPLAKDYACVITIGAVFQILGAGLIVLLRNEHKTYSAMIYTVIGLVIHIVLDYLLAEKYKLYGVAFSTVVSQAVIMILGLISLKTEKTAGFKKNKVTEILKASTAPVGLNFVPSAVLLFTNWFALEAGGTAAVSAYAVMSYAVYTFEYIYQGVCDGVQPIISHCAGSGNVSEKKRAVKCAVITLAAFSAVFAALTPALQKLLPGLFAVSPEAEKIMQTGLLIYAFAYPLKAAVKFVCSYYYATEQFGKSNLLTYIDPVVLTPLLLAVMPMLCGIDGLWLSLVASQTAVLIIAAVMFVIGKRKTTLEKSE